MASNATSPAELREQLVTAAETKAAEDNKARTGKGTRVRIGQTRGKNPQVIRYEAFDESLPDTLPVDLAEFMNLTKVEDEKVIVALLIDGFNSNAYTQASDPVAEYINDAWPEDARRAFRLAVRNYASAVRCSVEDAVAIIKPGFDKAMGTA